MVPPHIQPITSNEGLRLTETVDNLAPSNYICSQEDRLLYLKERHNEKFYELMVHIKKRACKEWRFD